jgi:lysophospholipid acyltransferase (LPLAT)-like uncharacterized protein
MQINYVSKSIQKKLILFIAHIVAKPLLVLFRSSLTIKLINRKYVAKCQQKGENIIYAFWHENMILPLLTHEKKGIYVLVSQHFDGEIISKILAVFGLPSIRGSSTRGGREAYEIMKKEIRDKRFEIAFTPDGPTGPRRQAKLGVVRLAADTGYPIIPVGVITNRFIRLKSWDRFLLILPFAKCGLIFGEPLYFPRTNNNIVLNDYAKELSEKMNDLEKEQ